MLGCIFDIICIIFGLILLIKGEITLGNTHYNKSVFVRLAGFALLLPMPVAFCVGMMIGVILQLKSPGQPISLADGDTQLYLGLVDFGIIIACMVLASILLSF